MNVLAVTPIPVAIEGAFRLQLVIDYGISLDTMIAKIRKATGEFPEDLHDLNDTMLRQGNWPIPPHTVSRITNVNYTFDSPMRSQDARIFFAAYSPRRFRAFSLLENLFLITQYAEKFRGHILVGANTFNPGTQSTKGLYVTHEGVIRVFESAECARCAGVSVREFRWGIKTIFPVLDYYTSLTH